LLILVINNADIGGIVDHHFLCWYCHYWLPVSMLILVELLITTFFVDIGGIVDHHFLLYQEIQSHVMYIVTCTCMKDTDPQKKVNT
jgi:hypothetical protein